ncbi:hypothetical protein JMY81_13950 [Brenneria goodwinii]|uniref:hypothetical protein n=1 Tax=Brenneria goodwinii TaxID=1109412 RepID=UPI000EF189F5|nr:hypothetical protein [Brenneria goodwinii]MCG8157596.1 hypothetical protein [Brenneria goodwinii]MCG8161919.1 hypothetical protein [Brenneria goodwinii]MCG8166716.1 hypothetical protein [Brenneria goodwinii]MCG8171175.1 hypothetical protein [Brenneria goodwinii]MCG8176257.1 hypothetical protein [Brenneria goodwinii]
MTLKLGVIGSEVIGQEHIQRYCQVLPRATAVENVRTAPQKNPGLVEYFVTSVFGFPPTLSRNALLLRAISRRAEYFFLLSFYSRCLYHG